MDIKSIHPIFKVGIILGILITASVSWWLIAPLFDPGETLDEEIILGTTTLYTGELQKIDDAHYGSGKINIINDSGNLQIQFINVEIVNGPALSVYLSSTDSFSSVSDNIGNIIDLGELPANNGNFTVDLKDTVNLENYKSVIIYCVPFDITFTFASLLKV